MTDAEILQRIRILDAKLIITYAGLEDALDASAYNRAGYIYEACERLRSERFKLSQVLVLPMPSLCVGECR